jgi:hypothetical protein
MAERGRPFTPKTARIAGSRGGKARKPAVWALVPGQEPGRQVRGLAHVDSRTRLGRLVKAFRESLVHHVTEKYRHPPDDVQLSYIEQAVTLRAETALIHQKIMEGTAGMHDRDCYLAWVNTLRRTLAALDYEDAAKTVRQTAEAKLMSVYGRR